MKADTADVLDDFDRSRSDHIYPTSRSESKPHTPARAPRPSYAHASNLQQHVMFSPESLYPTPTPYRKASQQSKARLNQHADGYSFFDQSTMTSASSFDRNVRGDEEQDNINLQQTYPDPDVSYNPVSNTAPLDSSSLGSSFFSTSRSRISQQPNVVSSRNANYSNNTSIDYRFDSSSISHIDDHFNFESMMDGGYHEGYWKSKYQRSRRWETYILIPRTHIISFSRFLYLLFPFCSTSLYIFTEEDALCKLLRIYSAIPLKVSWKFISFIDLVR